MEGRLDGLVAAILSLTETSAFGSGHLSAKPIVHSIWWDPTQTSIVVVQMLLSMRIWGGIDTRYAIGG
jgi:hypothetical protein